RGRGDFRARRRRPVDGHARPSERPERPQEGTGRGGDAVVTLQVGLTGSIAAGKSTVTAAWARAGVPVVSADELARRAVEPGSSGLAEVREAFGPGVLAPDGSLDRAAMRDQVFRDEAARARLG